MAIQKDLIVLENRQPMTNSIKLLFSLFFWVFATQSLLAQLNVIGAGGTSFSPEELISNVFLGEGVTVTNVTYKGAATQVGYFNGAAGDIGLDRGIVMTTGRADKVVGPSSDNPSYMAMTNVSDPDLKKIGEEIQPGADVKDVAIYEITFIPAADTLRFRYVFASEEYPEYVCTQYNDVFGFFISGPGINGSFSNNSKNIALIPDPADPSGYSFTTNYVSISNVNNGNGTNTCTPSYPQYYNDNSNGLNLSYDGFTNVFTAQAIVQPCQTYHIKLAVADLGDEILDTGVFLEAKSFGTGSIVANLNTISVDGTIVEGCSGATLEFETQQPTAMDLALEYHFLGTATHPDDYTMTKDGADFSDGDPLIIPAGDSSVSVDVFAAIDGLAENGEYIAISIQKDICTVDTVYIPIKDNVLVSPDLGQDTSICSNPNHAILHLDGKLDVPEPVAPTFTYTGNDKISNDDPPVNAPLNVFGVQPIKMAPGVIRSVCVKLSHKYDADVDLFLFSPNNTPLLLSSDNGNNSRGMDVCFKPTATAPVTSILDTLKAIFPPNGVVDFAHKDNLYFKGDFLPEGNFSDFWTGGTPSQTNGQWRLMVFDDQGSNWGDGATGNLKEWSITFEPTFKLTYQWENSDDLSCLDCPDPDLTLPDQTTTYTLTVHDSYGCSVQDSITVFVQDSLEAPSIDCQLVGANYITFSWTAVAGATAYEINIDGNGWQPVGNLLTYTQNGLSVNQTVTIQVRAIGNCPAKIGTHQCTTLDCQTPSITAVVTPAHCHGNSDGEIAITASGVYPPYTYTLSANTNNTGIFDNLAAGTHQIIITDNIGCTYPYDTLVTEPALVSATALETQSVDCFGDFSGAGAIVVSGGVWPFSFSLNGGSDSLITQVAAGSYPYIVTDNHGCTANGDLIITQNPKIQFQTQTTDLSCFESADGQIMITNLTGGSPGYQFQWDDDQNQTTPGAQNLEAGTYAVTVTDALGCTASANNMTLNQPAEITATAQTTDAVCGGAPGTATIIAEGGVGNYSYNWSDTGAGSKQRNDLVAGLYQVTITDQNNCTGLVSFDIQAPSDMVLTMNKTDVDCNGNNSGSASVAVSGGTAPYTYQWNDALLQTNKTAISLPANVYKVVVTDFKQCVQSNTIEVNEPTELVVDTIVQSISCFGASNGAITTAVSGGTPPYTYEYTLPDLTQKTTPNLENIPAGTYQLKVTDAHACQVDLTIVVSQPAPVTLSFTNSDSICFGAQSGFTQVNVTGGTAPYTYLWDNAGTTQKIENLAANTYTITVTDAAGCTYSDQTTIAQHNEFTAQLTQTPALCHDATNGAASVQTILINGATQPTNNYQFAWNTTPAQTNYDAYQLTGGQSYQVTITDKITGCTITNSIQIGNPEALAGKIVQVQDVTCKSLADGTAEVTGIGGTPDYSYQWDAAANNQTTATATQLAKGHYAVEITDANGCKSSINVDINEPNPLQIDLVTTDVNCAGEATGAIQSTVSGGHSPYRYLWQNGAQTADLQDITAGRYDLTVTDDNGCSEQQSTEITEPGEPLTATATTKDITCNGGRDGQILIASNGGTAPYLYSINNDDFTGINNKVGLFPGTYSITVKDARGCTTTIPEETITQPEAIELDLGPDIALAYGDSLQMMPDIQNAVGDITYEWTSATGDILSCTDCPNPMVSPSFQNFIYLYITDENGCSANAQIRLIVSKHTKIFVPTGFSPNEDSQNDRLYVVGDSKARIAYFTIFDRWGEEVFHIEDVPINDPDSGWDGTFRGEPLPTGQYVWQLQITMPDGRLEKLQGFSTLLR